MMRTRRTVGDEKRRELATLCSRTASLNVSEKGVMCCRRSLSPLRSAMVLCMRVLISCEPACTCSACARWLGSRFMEWRVRAANVYRGKAHAASVSGWVSVLVSVRLSTLMICGEYDFVLLLLYKLRLLTILTIEICPVSQNE